MELFRVPITRVSGDETTLPLIVTRVLTNTSRERGTTPTEV